VAGVDAVLQAVRRSWFC